MDATPPVDAPPPDGWIRAHVERAGLQVSAPVDWTCGSGLEGGVIVFTPPHPADAAFTSNLTIIARPVAPGDAGIDHAAEQSAALVELGDAQLLLSEVTTVGDRPAAHALVAYFDGEFELTLEQWIVEREGTVVAFTATVRTFDYAYDAQLYEDIVRTVVFDG